MKPPDEAHGLLCHYFSGPGVPPAQGSLSVEDFERLLDVYGNRLVPAKVWLQRFAMGHLTDEVVVTCDDGLLEAYSVALPVLEARGLTACWNVYTGPYVGVPNNMELYRWVRNHGFTDMAGFYKVWRAICDCAPAPDEYLQDRSYLTRMDKDFRYWRDTTTPYDYEDVMDMLVTDAGMDALDRQWWMSPTQLRNLHRSGHIIGIHTHSHPYDMTTLSLEQTALEYATSRAVLAGVLECEPKVIITMSHPRGLARIEGLGWLEANGFVLGWGATMEGSFPWRVPRWSTGHWRL